MRITAPGDIDLDVRPGATAAEVMAIAGLTHAWCGPVELDPDHPAGVPPLVHGARLSPTAAPSCLPPMGPHLVVAEGPDAGHTATLGSPVLIGRGEGAELRIDDPAVSAEHVLVSGTTRIRVRDLRSANGTRAPRLRRLRSGDDLIIGRSRVAVVDPTADAQGTEAPTPDKRSTPDATRRWGMLAGGLASGAALAAMTGRWQFAFVGLLPAAAPWVAQVFSRRDQVRECTPPIPVGPIAVRGEPEPARGYIRALLVERGRRPADDEWLEPWMRWLAPAAASDRIVRIDPHTAWPSWCPTRVDVTEHSRTEHSRTERHGDEVRTLLPLAMSAATADRLARRRASTAIEEPLPSQTRWADLASATLPDLPPTGSRSPRAAIGATADGPLVLDLDADGPHFLVAGTTGSGKSVALETLVTSLAYAYSPSDLTLALVDFKGGAGLRECMDLPHVAATLTDLDGALARRALAGLSHELATRKAALRERGFASLPEWEATGDAPPRLVVVIDEYQEIVSAHQTFLPDLARIAAQGRSLGLHLVLATQRPAGAVTPEVRANVSTTIALRVASSAESRDLLGTSDAAHIPASRPGRAIVARGSHHVETQIASPDAEPSPSVVRADRPRTRGTHAAVAAAERWRDDKPAQALWLPPLPLRWQPEAPRQGTIALARIDRPSLRAQHDAEWDPLEGAAIVIGTPRSGRTSALWSIAYQARAAGLTPVMLPIDPRLASRTLAIAAERPEILLIIDDIDAALTRLATVDDGTAVEDLTRRSALRLPTAIAGGPATPMRLAAAAAVVAVATGVDPTLAAQWGVPRTLVEHAGTPAPGRAHIRHHGDWNLGQLACHDSESADSLVHALPTKEQVVRQPGVLGIGGDNATALVVPPGPVTVVGPPGPTQKAVLGVLSGTEVTTVELPALVRPGAAAVVITEPTARAVRQLAPHSWRGVTDPHPVPGRVVIVQDGRAQAVQLTAR